MTRPYAPDLAEITEKARRKPMTPQQRENALDRIAEQRIALLDELAQLDAAISGHQQAQAAERASAAAIEDLLAVLDKWGYQPKTRRCLDCNEPTLTAVCRMCEEQRR